MSNLPLNFDQVFSALQSPSGLEVWEREGVEINGRWIEVETEHRMIPAIILQSKPQTLELLGEGYAALGGINVITNEKLYYLHRDGNQLQKVQTYARYQGLTFRLITDGWLNPNTNKYTYDLVRHEDNENT